MAAFAEFGLCPELAAATEEQGWSLPTDIQAEAIPLLLGGGDLLASAETGSGKTAAFALPLLQLVHEAQRGEAGSRFAGGSGLAAETGATSLDAGDRDEQVALRGGKGDATEDGKVAGDKGGETARQSAEEKDESVNTGAEKESEDAKRTESKKGSPVSSASSSSSSAPLVVAQSRDPSGFFGVRATRGLAVPASPSSSPCKASFAVLVEDGLVRLGWSEASASLDLGTDDRGWGFGGTGWASHGGAFVKFGETFGPGDVVESLLDLDAGEIRYAKNGRDLGVAFRLDFAKRTNDAKTDAHSPSSGQSAGPAVRAFFPTVALKNAQARVTFFEPDVVASAGRNGQSGEGKQGDESKQGVAVAVAVDGEGRDQRRFPPSAFMHASSPSYPPLISSPHAVLRSRACAQASAAPASSRGPLAIVLEPTRELAEQAFGVLAELAVRLRDPPVRCGLFLGGKGAVGRGGVSEPGDAREASGSSLQAHSSSPSLSLCTSGVGVDVAVGTASRMVDLADKGQFPVASVRHLVLDEADALLAYGHRDPVLRLWRRLPKASVGAARLQAALFSATLHDQTVVDMATRLCQDPIVVDLKGRDALPSGVQHAVLWVDPREDRSWLQREPKTYLDGVHTVKTDPDDVPLTAAATSPAALSLAAKTLKQRLFLRAVDALQVPRAIVFCRTNHDCDCLKAFLDDADNQAIQQRIKDTHVEGDKGPSKGEDKDSTGSSNATSNVTFAAHDPANPAASAASAASADPASLFSPCSDSVPALHSSAVLGGAKSSRDRRAALEAFKAGHVRFLIATDVAARGIDVRGLPYAFNMTLPAESEEYVHRVGRVGRAGAAGVAISLVSAVPERVWFVQKSGVKPWASKGGADKDDVSTHTVWVDEPELLAAVETRLQLPDQGIPRLQDDLSLPEGFVPGGEDTKDGQGGGKAAQAAAARAKRDAEALQARLAALQPSAKRLATLERESQERFFKLQQQVW